MWIEEVYIESFGACRRILMRGLGPGLTVLLGPNEAGKSTVVEFIRSVFFGFRRKSGRTNIYESPDKVLRSGWITVRAHTGGRLRLNRSEKQGLREGLLTITDEQGNEIAASWVNHLSAGLDRNSYENLFALDLEGIRRLDQEALRRKILATALGSITVSPFEIRSKLTETLKRVARCSVVEGESLWSARERLRQVDTRLRELNERPVQYTRLKEELESIEAGRTAVAASIETTLAALNDLSRLLRYEDQWKRHLVVKDQISRLGNARHFPPDGIPRLEHALEKRNEAVQELVKLEQTLDSLRDQATKVAPDETLMRHADTIGSLRKEAQNLVGRPVEIEKAHARLLRLGALLAEEINGLGRNWNRQRVASSDPSVVVEQEIRTCADAWKEHEETIRALAHSHRETSEKCERQRSRIQRIEENLERLAPSCVGYLPPESLRRLQEWKSHRSRVSDLEEKVAQDARRIHHLAAARQALNESLNAVRNAPARLVPPALFMILVLLVAIAGIGLIYSAWRVPDVPSYVFLFVAACLWLSVPVAIRCKILWERRHRDEVIQKTDFLTRQAAQVTDEIVHAETSRRAVVRIIENLRDKCATIASEILGDSEAGPNEVMRVEGLSRCSEEPTRRRKILEEALRSAQEELQIDEARKRESEAHLGRSQQASFGLKSEWQAFLSHHGFHSDLDPQSALVLLERLRGAKTRLRQLEEEEESLATITREWEDFTARVLSAAALLQRPLEAQALPLDQVDRWVQDEAESRRRLSEKEMHLEKIREREVLLGVLQKRLQEAEDQISELMEQAGVGDEESFREKSESHRRCQVLEQELRVLISGLVTGLCFRDEAQMTRFMGSVDWKECHKSSSDLRDRLADLRKESESLANLSGRLSREIESLEAEEETESLLQERERLRAKLNKLTGGWTTFKIALLLLEKTLNMYEREKQPSVLEKSSRILGEITRGAYVKILFPLDGDQVKVLRSDQSLVDERLLSRATLEQVCLSLKLAHLEVYGPDESIPVVVDDILVNFDCERAARTAQLLADFSERARTQVLFFTCHPHIAGLFPPTVSKITLEPLIRGDGPSWQWRSIDQVTRPV